MKRSAHFRILVVEDDAAIRRFITQWLADAGYETRAVGDGAAALDALGWHPDLILLDLQLPVMDGWQFLDRLTSGDRRPIPPVIVLTAAKRSQAELPRGAAAMLAKPFDFDLLARSIATYAGASTG